MIVATALIVPELAAAHAKHRSTSRWRLRVDSGVIGATMAFEASDLALSIALKDDPPPEGADKTARLLHVRDRAYAEFEPGIRVTNGGRDCPLRPLRFLRKTYYEIGLRWTCEGPLTDVAIELPFLDRLPNDHKQVARLDVPGPTGKVRQDVRSFTKKRRRFTWTAPRAPPKTEPAADPPPIARPTIVAEQAEPMGFSALVTEGCLHILSGWDHVLFLIALLAVGGTFWQLVQIVTAFTIAHSITLALAYLDIVRLDASIVEPAIAATIVFVAVENLWLRDPSRRWVLTFGFGLVHGLGFAGFLSGLQLPPERLVLDLFAFNLGVELGQVAIVAAAYPLIRLLSERPWHRARVVAPLSVAVAAAGFYWLLERTIL